MNVGAASTLRLVGAVFRFIADLFDWVAELAFVLGDPEVSTTVALIVVGCAASGRYAPAIFVLLVGTLGDLFYKNVLLPVEGGD